MGCQESKGVQEGKQLEPIRWADVPQFIDALDVPTAAWLEKNDMGGFKETIVDNQGYTSVRDLLGTTDDELEEIILACSMKPGEKAKFIRLLNNFPSDTATELGLPPQSSPESQSIERAEATVTGTISIAANLKIDF